MLIYSQGTGELRYSNGAVIARGYSGYGLGKNNPAMEDVQGVGPIPKGFWRIGTAYTSQRVGPVTIPLYRLDAEPIDDIDQVTGRSAFRIHGDSVANPGAASRGCIILPRHIRERILTLGSEILWIVE